jgi:hypothetical protein
MSAARVMAEQRKLGQASAARMFDVYPGLVDDDLTALAEHADSAHDGLVTKRLWVSAEDRDLARQRHAGLRVLRGAGGARTHDPDIMSPVGWMPTAVGHGRASSKSRSDGWPVPKHTLSFGAVLPRCPHRGSARESESAARGAGGFR